MLGVHSNGDSEWEDSRERASDKEHIEYGEGLMSEEEEDQGTGVGVSDFRMVIMTRSRS